MIHSKLSAAKVLIAEDELLITSDLAEAFEQEGAQVLGPASSVSRAIARLESDDSIDCGVLDLNLSGELVYPLADALAERHVPFRFTTGYGDEAIPSRFDHVPRLKKPATGEAAVEMARQLLMKDDQLYNLAQDPSETHDLIDAHGARAQLLASQFGSVELEGRSRS